MNRLMRLWFCLVLLGTAVSPVASHRTTYAAPSEQETDPDPRAVALLDSLTAEERVGQLFLVTFSGTEVAEGVPIYDLIINHHIGGVILLAENDNFIGPEGTVEATYQLTSQLQRLEWEASSDVRSDPTNTIFFQPASIPLIIGISQEGNGYPNDQILNGLSPLPNLLAIGATWNPNQATQVGSVLGKELSALGFNLLLGPSLDVLETITPEGPGDLGTRAFGGDPFWVGKLGQAYIAGVHEGSQQRMVVVGKHFPGLGGSDRLPTEEVATVRKSLEQLKQIELAPFFAVTGGAPDSQSTVDALLSSHIRYQGLQGNIRATTSPISFDPQAFELLMGLPQLAVWRENGGVVVSDDLGSRAVRRFFESSGQAFDSRIVARNAFLAGNDLLYLGNFVGNGDPDSYTSILRTLEFFAQKYREDPAFQQRVDQSVLRILTMKFKLYPNFTLDQVLPPESDLVEIGKPAGTIFNVASRAATLISPDASELDNALPNPPDPNDRYVIFTDSYPVRQCSACPEQPVLAADAFQQAIVSLYGPEAGAQVQPFNIASFSFSKLTDVLNAGAGDTLLERAARRADWILFVMLDENANRPASLALRRFLDERPDLYRRKRLVVFAFDAPHYLDATDVAKLTVYYGLYSKVPQFVDVAARLLFKELRPIPGALPVSVPGVGYDLFSETSPNPAATIQLFLDLPQSGVTEGTGTPEPTAQPDMRVGDLIPLRTGVILDHNGNPVPDGTTVRFIMTIGGLESPPQVETTVNGIARTTLIAMASGTLTVLARSGEPAAISNVIQIDIPTENGGTLEPSSTASATIAPTAEPTATKEPTPVVEVPPTQPPHARTDLMDWLLAVSMTAALGWLTYRFGTAAVHVRWGMRWGLCVLVGGLVLYAYLSLQLPGASWLLETWGRWGVVASSLGGSVLGLAGGWGWRRANRRETS